MKTLSYTALLFSLLIHTQGQAQPTPLTDSTGLAGDNFSLQGALEQFKKASTLEDFEKRLNTESNHVNNLDLNGDKKTDYIQVSDRVDKDVHAILLQIQVNAKETQDVAVIELERTSEKTAVLQIVGSEALYGKDAIAEPQEITEQRDGSSKGPFAPAVKPAFVMVNVWYWPVVSYLYAPDYVVWVSPWYWDYYPAYWNPWYVRPWHMHHYYCAPYYPYYNVTYVYRAPRAHNVYHTHRRNSPTVQRNYAPAQARHATVVKQQQSGRGRAGQEPSPAGTTRQPQNQVRESDNNSRRPVAQPAEPAQGERRRPVQTREISPQAPQQTPARTNQQPVPQTRERQVPAPRQQRAEPRRESPQARPQQPSRPVQTAPRSAPRQQGNGGQRRGGR